VRYADVTFEDGLVDAKTAAMQQLDRAIVDTRGRADRFEPSRNGFIAGVNLGHRGILVADKKLDRAILPGLKARRLPKQSTKLRVLAGRHRAKHIPSRVELLEDPGYPRQCLESRLQVVSCNQPAGGTQFVDRKLHPKLRRLMLDDEQHLIMRSRERPLCLQNPVELEIA
jgi:hypothetical protein